MNEIETPIGVDALLDAVHRHFPREVRKYVSLIKAVTYRCYETPDLPKLESFWELSLMAGSATTLLLLAEKLDELPLSSWEKPRATGDQPTEEVYFGPEETGSKFFDMAREVMKCLLLCEKQVRSGITYGEHVELRSLVKLSLTRARELGDKQADQLLDICSIFGKEVAEQPRKTVLELIDPLERGLVENMIEPDRGMFLEIIDTTPENLRKSLDDLRDMARSDEGMAHAYEDVIALAERFLKSAQANMR